MQIINNIEKLHPISIRVPKNLRDDLLRQSKKNRRSLSSFCRITLEDNYLLFGKNHRYDKLHYKNENLVPLSFTLSDKSKEDILSHIMSFNRHGYNAVVFSLFVRKVLSDSLKVPKL
ncbi:hypothetical protein SDC9_55994 [bioreactor metagenome]|uniref:Uncharacterized protein n=1 Tax=bioreactor metagenome TaxID=1076179 RepID=A0A644X0L7_9ZZZZ|nr:hypothetical protein [Paludibacter sp.]